MRAAHFLIIFCFRRLFSSGFPSSPQKDVLLQPRPVPSFCTHLFYWRRLRTSWSVTVQSRVDPAPVWLGRRSRAGRAVVPWSPSGTLQPGITGHRHTSENSCIAAFSVRCSDVRIEYLVFDKARPAGAKLLESAGWVCCGWWPAFQSKEHGTRCKLQHPGCVVLIFTPLWRQKGGFSYTDALSRS